MSKKGIALPIWTIWGAAVLTGVLLFLVYITLNPYQPGGCHMEELKVINHTWDPNNAFIVLIVKNTGTRDISVSSVRVDDVAVAESNVAYGGDFTGTTHTLRPGASGIIIITHAFSSGIKYEFEVITAPGNVFTYVVTALGLAPVPIIPVERLTVINHTWASDLTYIDLVVKSTGDLAVSMSETRVNGLVVESNVTSTPLQPGDSVVVRITPRTKYIINYPIVEPPTFTSGDQYLFMIDTLTHRILVEYVATAP